MAAGVQIPLRVLRATLKRSTKLLKGGIAAQESAQIIKQSHALLPSARSNRHYASRIKVANRWYSTFVNELRNVSRDVAPQVSRNTRQSAIMSRAAANPFVSALRPRLVGGAMPRSAGGYSLGGSARHFSHAPAPAQIVSHVSALARAFGVHGVRKVDRHQRAGTDWLIGVRAQVSKRMETGGTGAYIDFGLFPNLSYVSSLGNPALFQGLEDGSENLAAVSAELGKLRMVGDLTTTRPGDILRVHFSGCDKAFVKRICEELGVEQGVIHENETFVFPGLPDYEPSESSASSSTYSESIYSGFSADSETSYEPPTYSPASKSTEASLSPAFLAYLESSEDEAELNFESEEEDDDDGDEEMELDSSSDAEYEGDIDSFSGSGEITDGASTPSIYSDSSSGAESGIADEADINAHAPEAVMAPEADWSNDCYAGLRSRADILTPSGSVYTGSSGSGGAAGTPDSSTGSLEQERLGE